jgi:hypothetical protein
MPTTAFDRDAMAADYARRHRAADSAIVAVYYLPSGSPHNEIRLVEVNKAITGTAHPEPIDFGVDGGTAGEHKLVVFDVTPEQWEEVGSGDLDLPKGWSLEGSQEVGKGRSRRK